MRAAPIHEIILVDRQRRVFDRRKLTELAESIASKSLMHAVVCVETEGVGLVLVAGERRIRAIKELYAANRIFSFDGTIVPPGTVPYVLISDLDAIDLREAELEENVQREDLTWQEKVAALDELHSLRTAQDPTRTVVDTAREITTPQLSTKRAEAQIAEARILVEHLGDAEVAQASSAKAAYRLVRKKVEAEFTAKLAEMGIGTEHRHNFIEGDLHWELRQLHQQVLIQDFTTIAPFSCVIADPPYGMGADKFGDAASRIHDYDDTWVNAESIYTSIFSWAYELATENAHIYIFCDVDHFVQVKNLAIERGWHPWRTPLMWNKVGSGSFHAPARFHGFRRSYELIFFASKGNRPFSMAYSDIIECPADREKDVAAQKPVALYKTLLQRSCLPGEHVLDPCCGRGTIFLAAEDCQLTATGIEQNPEAIQMTKATLALLGGSDDET